MTPTATPTDTPQPVIHPSIGRRVWYWPSQWDISKSANFLTAKSSAQAMDAGVCFVHSPRMVNLLVTDHSGSVHARTSVRLLQGDEQPVLGEAYAQWMPYQASQAAKTGGVDDLLNGETANVLKGLSRGILELVGEVRELRKLAQVGR